MYMQLCVVATGVCVYVIKCQYGPTAYKSAHTLNKKCNNFGDFRSM